MLLLCVNCFLCTLGPSKIFRPQLYLYSWGRKILDGQWWSETITCQKCVKNAVKSTRIWCGTRVPGTRCALLRVQNARQTRGSNMMCLLHTLKYRRSRYCPRRAYRYHRTVKTALTRDVCILPWRPRARVWSQKVPQISGFNMHCQT